MKTKKWIKSPWTISFTTALFSFFLTLIRDYIKDLPILSTISYIFFRLRKLIIDILTFELKVWWLITGIIVFIFIIEIIFKFKKSEVNKPDFINYTEDVFKSWRWTWKWNWNTYKKEWRVNKLKAHCPECDTPMIEHQNFLYGSIFECPRCDFSAKESRAEKPHKIESLIIDNLNRKKNL